MATLQEIRTKVDTFLADLWVNTIVPKQEAYFIKHGRYFGLRVTSETIPEDDVDVAGSVNVDPAEPHPEDYSFTLPSLLPCVLSIHQHGSAGFTATVVVKVLGKTYSRQKSYGTVDNDKAWYEVPALTT